MGLLNLQGIGSFIWITRTDADLGDWLCKVMGICA